MRVTALSVDMNHYTQTKGIDKATIPSKCASRWLLLYVMKANFLEKLILSHTNTRLIRNKFDSLVHMIDKNVDIFLITERKLDDSFPIA